MCVRICQFYILIYFIHFTRTDFSNAKQTFEYGVQMPGEQLSFAIQDSVPAYNPIYVVKNITPHNPDTEKRFTYLRVDYLNTVSKVEVTYDAENATLTFFVKFPFMQTALRALGYSMPLSKY